jgi:hypothetical protein
MTTATEQKQMSADLEALLKSKGIDPQPPQPSETATKWQELFAAYETADREHSWQRSTQGLHSWRAQQPEAMLEKIEANIEIHADKAKREKAALKAMRNLQSAIGEGQLTAYNAHLSAVTAWQDSLREIVEEANADNVARFGEPFDRFEKALSEISKAGIVVKKSKRSLWKIAEGVPVLYAPDGWATNQRQIHFSQIGLIADDQLTPTGEMVLRKFSVERLNFETHFNGRWSQITVKLSRSLAAMNRPEIQELEDYLGRWY